VGEPVVVESWHVPRALSDKALRLLTSLPMEEIERRLRVPDLLTRAADLLELEHQPLRPIPVSEQLPGPSCCNALGYCWWYDHRESAWIECDVLFGQRCGYRHWLPAHALPLPEFE